jgi:hypothetical protein
MLRGFYGSTVLAWGKYATILMSTPFSKFDLPLIHSLPCPNIGILLAGPAVVPEKLNF